MSAGAIDERFEQLSEIYLGWAWSNRRPPFLNAITRMNIGWPDTSHFPNGMWSKGRVTTSLCEFFEDFALSQNYAQGTLLRVCQETNAHIQSALRRLYSADVWIPCAEAAEIAESGLAFLAGYARLATMSLREHRQPLFPHMPKGHGIHHVFHDLKKQSQIRAAKFCINPLCHSVQISEDYVGRVSRLSRRTGVGQAIKRVVQRNLQACYKHWRDEGYLK